MLCSLQWGAPLHRLCDPARKTVVAVKGTRGIGKRDMVLNDALPVILVDPEKYEVTVEGGP